jgi:hypothetical protein
MQSSAVRGVYSTLTYFIYSFIYLFNHDFQFPEGNSRNVNLVEFIADSVGEPINTNQIKSEGSAIIGLGCCVALFY